MPEPSRRNLYILVFVLFVIMLGYGVIIPILPFYIESMGAGGLELGLLVASYAAMRLVCGPVWGAISDRVGRKPVLLIGILGYAVTMFWFGLATRLWMLFAARILAGILSSATAPTTMAYISDSTPQQERGGGMGLLGAAGGIGTIVGPAFGGFFGSASLSMPFFIAGGLSLLSLLLAIIFLPESLPGSVRSAARGGSRILDVGLWVHSVRGPLAIIFVLTFISTCGLMIFANIFGLYALERCGFGPQQVGVMLMVLGLASTLAQGLLAGPLTRHWGDAPLIRWGFLATAIAFGLFLLSDAYVLVMLTTAGLGLATALQMPALMSLTSKRAAMSHGLAMGLSNSFISLGRIVGPILGGLAFDVHLSLPYLGSALFMLVGFAVSLRWLRPEKTAQVFATSGP